jgi:WD40 repeat protein
MRCINIKTENKTGSMQKSGSSCIVLVFGLLFVTLACHPVHGAPSQETGIWVYNFSAGEREDETEVWNIAISDDGHYIAVGANGGTPGAHGIIYYFDTERELLVWKTPLEGAVINDLDMSADGSRIAVGSQTPDSGVYLLSGSGKILWVHQSDGDFPQIGISDDGSIIVAPSTDGRISTYTANGTLVSSYDSGSVPSGVVMSGSGSPNIIIVSTGILSLSANGERVGNFSDNAYEKVVALSRDGSTVAYETQDDTLYVLDNNGKVLWNVLHQEELDSLALSDDGSILVGGSNSDQRICVWNRSGTRLWAFDTGQDIDRVAISGDGRYIAAAAIQSASWHKDGYQSYYIFSQNGTLLLNRTYAFRDIDTIFDLAMSRDGRYSAGSSRAYNLVVVKTPGYTPPQTALPVPVQSDVPGNSTGSIPEKSITRTPGVNDTIPAGVSGSLQPTPRSDPQPALQPTLAEPTAQYQSPAAPAGSILALAIVAAGYCCRKKR